MLGYSRAETNLLTKLVPYAAIKKRSACRHHLVHKILTSSANIIVWPVSRYTARSIPRRSAATACRSSGPESAQAPGYTMKIETEKHEQKHMNGTSVRRGCTARIIFSRQNGVTPTTSPFPLPTSKLPLLSICENMGMLPDHLGG